MSRIALFIGSVLFLFEGVMVLLGYPIWVKYKGWQHYSILYGFGSILISFFLFYFFKNTPNHSTTKCPKCKEVFEYKDTLEGKCPHCKDVDTIELKEYYKKYPDEKKSDL